MWQYLNYWLSPFFGHWPLLGGILIVGVPVLIHLINMLRHQRVEWAAMEFLLQSQKKHRTWIILKQILLLLMRMLAIAVVVLIVAKPKLPDQLGRLLGGTQTHHIVLLDDSFSMSDRWEGTSAFDRAKTVVRRIADGAVRQNEPQQFTLLRFSRATQTDRGTDPDMLKRSVNSKFDDDLNQRLEEMKVSQTAAGPGEPLQRIGQLLAESEGDRQIVYVVTDFRVREWDAPTDLKNQLLEVNAAGGEVHLINCVETVRPNLAITSLAPTEGVRTAGVPWFMEVTVQNFGKDLAGDVSVLLEEDGHSRAGVTIREIPPGRAVTERFQVRFPTDGPHRITARLESDAVKVDNSRFATVDLPADVPVLIIDGDPGARDGRFLSIASSPGGAITTGLRPQIETPRFLGFQPLDEFCAINLANIERLDRSAIEALEAFVEAGGGAVFFLGERSRSRFINEELYRNGKGLFPVPLIGQEELLIDRLDRAPDVSVDDHFIFRVFGSKRNDFLDAVVVQRYFAVPKGWEADPDSMVRVIARLRNGAPLVVERSFGAGRVVAFLTTAAPVWNNWARNPSFVVAVQDLQAYLAHRGSDDLSHQVGSKLELALDPAAYEPKVRFVPPRGDASREKGGAAPEATVDAVPTAGGLLTASFSETGTSGVYEAILAKTNGAGESRRFAVNVEPSEGNLEALLSGRDLTTRLSGVKYDYRRAADFQYEAGDAEGGNLSQWLLAFLVLLLICEQIVAWWASYHPAARRRALPTGGVA